MRVVAWVRESPDVALKSEAMASGPDKAEGDRNARTRNPADVPPQPATATGGILHCTSPWNIEDESLTVISYIHRTGM